jgi:hypothetical protein
MKHCFIVLTAAVIASAPCGCRSRKGGQESGGTHDQEHKTMEKTDSEISSTSVNKTIAMIVEQAPSSLSRMEAVVGKVARDAQKETFHLSRQKPVEGVAGLEIEFSIDIHHQDPFKVKDPAIGKFTLEFEAGADFCMDALAEKYGKPRTLEQEQGKGFRFDTGKSFHPLHVPAFYLFPREGGAFRLLWCEEVPGFAAPSRTAGATEALTQKIVGLIEGGISRPAVEAAFGRLSLDKDWNCDVVRSDTWTFTAEPAGKDPFDRFTIHLAPALPAGALTRALGVKDPVVVSTDVHMTSRVIADYKTRELPRAGEYTLYIHVIKEGLKTTELDWPASAVWKGKELLIDSIEGFVNKNQ